ncbi:CocE/NonD family hydrolase [Aureimonas populi]|uniref:CocE/NonD family hydrolase n=1 Tax=Aureimonas populi TaxID=1701758 RepID=A0ABW5CLC7_9HYPH|nr:CocE/NonD family hydrolase [Aureimonas populi]
MLPDPVEVSPDVVVHRNVMVAMRDGVRLATDIYRPAHDGRVPGGPLPVIFERTPYDKGGRPRTEFNLGMAQSLTRPELAVELVRRGYVVIWQDCRGRYLSEGEFTKYLSEGEDGYDALEWIAAQEFSGRIGMMGLSYDAHTQMAAACLNPPALACMAVDSGGFANAYRCGIRQGGAFELKQATWAYHRAIESRAAEADPSIRRAVQAENLHEWFKMMPWGPRRSPVRWEPDYESYLLEQWQRGTFDDFWKKVGIYAAGFYDTFPKIPTIFMSSWYDAYVHSTLDNYEGLKGDPERPLTLIMGPWTHGNRTQRVFGDVDFGDRAPFDGNVADNWLEYRIRFFDRWLKDEPAAETPPVHVFVMGGGSGRKTAEGKLDHGGRWIEAQSWPLPGTRERFLYLRADMTLGDTPEPGKAAITYDFDPSNPVPTIGGSLTSGEPIFTGGAFDQREDERFFGCRHPGLPLAARHDVLSFETEPLAEDVQIVGPLTIELFVSSDAPDTDFTAKLVDVYPPSEDYPTGFAMNVTDGIFRCRYRKGWDTPELLVKGEVFRIEIEPFATANLFAKGHRIRLDISSSNFPKYDVNPNTGAPEGCGRSRRVARNSVHLSRETPSRLSVRVLPASA